MNRLSARRTIAPWLAGAALLLTVGLAAPGGGTAPADAAAVGCDAGQSAARATRGMQGADPNSVTTPASRRMDGRLQQRVDRLVERGVLKSNGEPRTARRITVPTHVHVITAPSGAVAVTRQQIREQIQVLNDAYGGRTSTSSVQTPFRFKLVSTDVTVNRDWYFWHVGNKGESETAVAAKKALHQGGWGDLNIYIASLDDTILGYAQFPWQGNLALDGLVLSNQALPGGAYTGYDEGDTATHEIGHWLGLFHTFQNGCKKPGDLVADTPYQDDGDNIYECNESDDTCTQPGSDPVHNFMSYGDDPCLDRFTRGQARRMVAAWLAFRA
ncbi:hypothetical protein GCM10009844_24420 [Nocardioides koreensis]|uniref:Peptidase M43 pregnancy-associated plasma-A domain-containing protein n=1 Tax=Nocardioides koreensis TaxID=433651 RepID=A0ABN2ZUJ2_9ACTN